MRSISILLLTVILFAADISVSAKDDKKKPANELGVIAGGVVYSLPRTGIRLKVEVEQEKFFHGPYFEYGQKYLGLKNSPSADWENWTITSIKLETFGEPDPGEVYKATGPVASLLSLSESGVLLGINSNVAAEPAKVYTSDFNNKVKVPAQIWPEMSMHSFLSEKDSVQKSSSSLKSFEEKAAEAAHDILKLRKRKALALAANYDKLPPDGKAYQVMVDELDKIIDDYVALFSGKSFTEKHEYVFEVVPEGKDSKGFVAFRFSPSTGVLPENNVSGKPIMIELEANAALTQKSQSTAAVQAVGETATKGLFYRVPGFAVARVLNGSEVLAQSRISVAQFGVVTPIPDGLLNGDYSFEFHPVTGAIRKIETY
jgi:hypothetical protein